MCFILNFFSSEWCDIQNTGCNPSVQRQSLPQLATKKRWTEIRQICQEGRVSRYDLSWPVGVSVTVCLSCRCWSYVGKTFDTGAQELSIGIGCESQATILHEMMHAAGFFHEQARYDRDQYVIVKYENMVDGK